MPIARNKPNRNEAEIEAFGAAADAHPEKTSLVPEPPALEGGPKSSLIRWQGHEELRDAIIAYHNAERWPIHTLLIEAIKRGFEQIEKDGLTPGR